MYFNINVINLVYLKSYYFTESSEYKDDYFLNIVIDYIPQA